LAEIRTAAQQTAAAQTTVQTAWEPLIVAFLCNWCSYAGADLAGSSRLTYPPNVRVVRVPCSGRVNPLFILSCFKKGFDGVLVAGCHPGDCHYVKGNYYARRRMPLAQELLDFMGVEPARIRFDWVSAAESGRFAQVVQSLTEQVRAVGPFAVNKRHV
jgi:F420-non-reducing hydrogenase iron-sulfur subunit